MAVFQVALILTNRESCAWHMIELKILPKITLVAWFIVFVSERSDGGSD